MEKDSCAKSTDRIPSRPPQGAYAAVARDDAVRRNSSSGGVFTLLAEEILSRGGVVYGAALSADCRTVEHIAVTSPDRLDALRGSKYVFSRIGDTYDAVRQQLDAGRPVLFTGTPCQVAGLYAALGGDRDGLYTQDVVCHGAPQPAFWEEYVVWREKEAGRALRQVSFREKSTGWKNYSVQFTFDDGTVYKRGHLQDPYMRGFLQDLTLRPACYHCRFKGTDRAADITLADLWNVQTLCPSLYDDLGTSLVLTRSDKGQALWEAVADRVKVETVDATAALNGNPAALRAAAEPPARTRFLKAADKYGLPRALQTFCKPPFKTRIKRFVRSLLGK